MKQIKPLNKIVVFLLAFGIVLSSYTYKNLDATKLKSDNSTQALSYLPGPLILKTFRINDVQLLYGIWQLRSDQLAPVGFNWGDNGIPLNSIDFYSSTSTKSASQSYTNQPYFQFASNSDITRMISVTAEGYGTGGYYWYQLNDVWAGNIKFWVARP